MNTQTRVPGHPTRAQNRYDRMVRDAGGRSRFVPTRTGRAHVVEDGDGLPVVHLHGNNTSSLSHLMLLEHTTAVHSFLVDRPGFGLSDPSDFRRTGLRQHAVGFVDDVLDGLGLESAVLVGASGGGIWSVWYASIVRSGCGAWSCSGPSRCCPVLGFPSMSGSWRPLYSGNCSAAS